MAEKKKECCALCQKESVQLQCSRCKSVRYCNAECQKSDWERHKKECEQFSMETTMSPAVGALPATCSVEEVSRLIWETVASPARLIGEIRGLFPDAELPFQKPRFYYGRFATNDDPIERWYVGDAPTPESLTEYQQCDDLIAAVTSGKFLLEQKTKTISHQRGAAIFSETHPQQRDVLAHIGADMCGEMTLALLNLMHRLIVAGVKITIRGLMTFPIGQFFVPSSTSVTCHLDVCNDPSVIPDDKWPSEMSTKDAQKEMPTRRAVVGFAVLCSENPALNVQDLRTLAFLVDVAAICAVKTSTRDMMDSIDPVWPCSIVMPKLYPVDRIEFRTDVAGVRWDVLAVAAAKKENTRIRAAMAISESVARVLKQKLKLEKL